MVHNDRKAGKWKVFIMVFGKKKEDVFFTLFKDFASELSIMGKEFENFFNTFSADSRAAEIMKAFESQCDSKKHAIINQLNDSFVTPFDREDIFALADQLDDIADFLEDIVCKFGLYNVSTLRDDAKDFIRIIVLMTEQIRSLFNALPDFKNGNEVKTSVISINALENEGDVLFRKALATLFREESDPIEIIKWKDMYELLEDTLDAGEHLADTVEGIMAKYA